MGKLGHADGAAALGRHPAHLGHHRIHVPDRSDRQRNEPSRMGAAPLVHVPVVVGLEHDERQLLVLRLLEPAATEPRKAGEAHGGKNAVAVHVSYPFVDEVGSGPHFGERARIESPLLFRPRHGGIEAEDAEHLALEFPMLLAVGFAHQARGAVAILRRKVVREQIRRLNRVVVDAQNDHVVE